MMAPLPANESERLASLRHYKILDTPPEPAFDDIAKLASQICGVPVALVSLVDEDRQWFKARLGVGLTQLPRDLAFCAHAILTPHLMQVSDLTRDPRFYDNPLVTGETGARFYAGAPLIAPSGYALGTLCVVDRVPRDLTVEQQEALIKLGRLAVTQMELHRASWEQIEAAEQSLHLLAESQRAESELRESQRMLTSLMGNLPGMVYRCLGDRHWTIDFVSQGCCELTGYSPEEFVATGTLDELIEPAYRAIVSGEVTVALAARRPFCLTYPIVTRDGLRKWVSDQGGGVFSAEGKLRHIEGFITDVTERVRAETALRESENELQKVTDNVPVLISRIDASERYLFANKAYEDYLGISTDTMLGKTMTEVLGESVVEVMRPFIQKVLAGEKVVYEPTVHIPKIGRRSLHTSYVPERNAGGRVMGWLVSAVDITEQKEAERLLKVSEQRLKSLFDNGPSAIICLDRCGVVTAMNPAAEALLGRGPAELVGCDDLRFIALADRPLMQDIILETFAGTQRNYEMRYLCPDGEEVLIRGCSAPITVEGEIVGIYALASDITRQREGERERQRLSDNIRLLLESTGEGIYGIDPQGRCTFINPAATRMLRCMPEDVLGQDVHVLFHHSHADGSPYPAEHCPINLAALNGHECRVDYEVMWRTDGTSFPAHYSAAPLVEDGVVRGCVITCVDITDRKALETERERLLDETERLLAAAVERADCDPLTGLLNHRAFHKRLHEEADRAQRAGQSLAVVMFDLDNFKFFNDVYGHQAGDEVLRRVADGLRESCRSYDVLARFGGDEFALLMPGLTAADAEERTQRFVQKMAERGFTPPGHDTPIPLGLSAGVAVYPDDAAGRVEVIDLADSRLRLAKTGADEMVVAAQHVRREAAVQFEGFPMLDALVAAVDNKDRYTRRHSEEVLAYSLEIACELGWPERAQHTLAVAALLHDVGKIGVPDYILRKPGRLSEEEFEAMKQHPMMGAVMVSAVPGFEDTLDAIRHHHERWDGAGYPFGLQGETIPTMARLLAVADSFSAMTTDRPYRKGMSAEKALCILREGAGTQWDSEMVVAFLRAKAQVLVHNTSGDSSAADSAQNIPSGL